MRSRLLPPHKFDKSCQNVARTKQFLCVHIRARHGRQLSKERLLFFVLFSVSSSTISSPRTTNMSDMTNCFSAAQKRRLKDFSYFSFYSCFRTCLFNIFLHLQYLRNFSAWDKFAVPISGGTSGRSSSEFSGGKLPPSASHDCGWLAHFI